MSELATVKRFESWRFERGLTLKPAFIHIVETVNRHAILTAI